MGTDGSSLGAAFSMPQRKASVTCSWPAIPRSSSRCLDDWERFCLFLAAEQSPTLCIRSQDFISTDMGCKTLHLFLVTLVAEAVPRQLEHSRKPLIPGLQTIRMFSNQGLRDLQQPLPQCSRGFTSSFEMSFGPWSSGLSGFTQGGARV